MAKEIEEIKMLVNSDNVIEGILIKYLENRKHKYCAEHVNFIFTKKDEKDFNLLVTRILFDSNCNKKTKFVYYGDNNFYNTYELIRKNKLDDRSIMNDSFLTFYGCISQMMPIAALAGVLSIKHLHDINKRIKVFGKTVRTKTKRKLYATIIALNLLSNSIYCYNELTKTQLEKDVEDFKSHKDDSIENPFDLDIDYNNDAKIELLMTAIKENPNLEDTDKAILYKFKSFFKDNPYIDYKYLYDKFANLGIIYTEEKNEYNDATYFVKDDYIIDYEYIGEGKYHQEEISHLLMGLIGSFEDYPCLSRGMQEYLTKYYITKDIENTRSTYSETVPNFMLDTYSETVANFMLETVGKETLLEAYSTNNFGIIEEKLKEINDNEEDYNRLIYILKNPEPYTWHNFYYNDWLDIKNRYDCYNRHYTESKDSGFQKSKTKISQKG